MRLKLKVVLQILLINLITFSSFNINKAYSKITDCYNFKKESVNLEDTNYPLLIEVTTPNLKKWITRVLKSMSGPRIDKRYKKYQKTKIVATFPNNVRCEYIVNMRIHGSTKAHINTKNYNTSVRIKIENGHINNKYNFALLNKKTVRFNDEIFVSSLFKEIGYLSPLIYKTKVKMNNNETEEYLFHEMPTLEMAKDNKRNNGIFLLSNKNNWNKLKTKFHQRRSIILNRIKNSDGIASNNSNTILYALDKINFIYLNSLGIGDGKHCCESKINEINENKSKKIKSNYKHGNYALNFSILDDLSELENISIFNLIMHATNSQHGMAMEDRSFYYDPTFDRIEPIYRDGDPRIVANNEFTNNLQLFEFEKKYINKAISKIEGIDINKFYSSIKAKGFDYNKVKLQQILNDVIQNLQQLKSLELFTNHKNDLAKNYFSNHFDKNLSFNLAFGGINDQFEVCDISLKNCKITKLNQKQKIELFKDKFLKHNEFSNLITYVRLSKDDYKKNIFPKKRGLKNFKKILIGKEQILFHNTKDKNIEVDIKNKTINLIQENLTDKFIFSGYKFENWNINFIGSKDYIKNYNLYKRDENMLGGCLVFINAVFKNISAQIETNTCSKGIEVINSKGNFKEIVINKSKLDAFDAEFSDLSIESIEVNDALKGECIGLKRGNYLIKNAIVKNCGDHSISVGEHAVLNLKKVTAHNSRRIMSKDSSKIIIDEYNNIASDECLLILRKKKQYDGALIEINKNKLNCENQKIEKDEFSRLNLI